MDRIDSLDRPERLCADVSSSTGYSEEEHDHQVDEHVGFANKSGTGGESHARHSYPIMNHTSNDVEEHQFSFNRSSKFDGRQAFLIMTCMTKIQLFSLTGTRHVQHEISI